VIGMKPGMNRALLRLEDLLEADDMTAGLLARAHGENLIIGRTEKTDSGEDVSDDRVRLTRLSTTRWGLSVKRHTGRWERTPFSGTMEEMVEAVCTFMQHLVAPY